MTDGIETVPDDVAGDFAVTRGAHLARFQIAGVLGRGAMGIVLAAYDPQLDRTVAVKLVLGAMADARPATTTTRVGEARAMAQLAHPNVVAVHETGVVDAMRYIVMEHVSGGNLRAWLTARPRGWRAVLAMLVAAGDGLAAAHRAGLVHRDFKPENVLIGGDGRARVSDFGLASLRSHRGTGGTPGYMAPEQQAGEPVDDRADQYAFCVAVWEAVHGARPGSPAALPAVRQRRAPAWLYRALLRGLAPRRDDRWPTMSALLAALRPVRRARRVGVALAVLALVLAGVLATAMRVVVRAAPSTSSDLPAGLVQVTHRGDLRTAGISPDGTQIAFVAGDALIVRRVDAAAEDRVVIAHGISDRVLSWSPDGDRLIAATSAAPAGEVHTVVIDVATGAHAALPRPGIAAFLSAGEVAITAPTRRDVEILPLAAHALPGVRCEVPGVFDGIGSIDGMPDGTMVIRSQRDRRGALIVLAHDCRVLGTYAGQDLASVAVSDTGTVVALVRGDGFGELVELAVDGAVRSRRRVSGEQEAAIGRRGGVDYLLALSVVSHLERVHGAAPPTRVFTTTGAATFDLSPRGDTLAWIETGGRTRPRGPLRLSTLDALARRGRPLLDQAVATAWSPDGSALATVVDDDQGVAVMIVDPAGRVHRRLPLSGLDARSRPVWLSDHRIAARRADHRSHAWFDLTTSASGVFDPAHGSIQWLTRSRDGALAMWRGAPLGASGRAAQLWVAPPGQPARPVAIDDADRDLLLPSWTAAGGLLVRALATGVVSRVSLATGGLTPVAQLAPRSAAIEYDEHLMTLPDGDLLTVEPDLDINVFAARVN